MKKLTDAQLKVLAVTTDDNLLTTFPGYTRAFLRREKKKLGSVLEQVDVDRKLERAKVDIKTQDTKYKEALKKIDALEVELGIFEDLKHNQKTIKILPTKSKDSEATAVIVASDWHIEERVDPDTINGLNRFNLEIAEERARHLFINAVKLLKKEQVATEINTVILALLGDFFSGTIHDSLKELRTSLNNTAILKVQELLASGIKYILEQTDCNLVIPCCSGNHARQTDKLFISTEYENSYETLIYKSLELMFSDNKRVQFSIKKSYHNILEVYGYKVRFHHGHALRYAGGVGGIYIPVNKAIAQWNKSIPCYLDVFGHFHTCKDGGNFIANGSLIGFNAYAINIKADFEPPRQQFFLIDKEHGKTIVAPIFLEER